MVALLYKMYLLVRLALIATLICIWVLEKMVLWNEYKIMIYTIIDRQSEKSLLVISDASKRHL